MIYSILKHWHLTCILYIYPFHTILIIFHFQKSFNLKSMQITKNQED